MKPIQVITPELVLRNVDQSAGFSLYLDNQNIQEGSTNIINTIRGESTPSVSCLLTHNDILYLKDFACAEYKGNLISWCILYYRQRGVYLSYQQAARQVYEDLKVDIIDLSYKPINNYKYEKVYSEIVPTVQEFTSYDLDYWKRFYIEKEDLKRFKTYSLKSAFIKGKSLEMFRSTKEEPLFGYKFPFEGKWQLYRPLSDKMSKWRINHEFVDAVGLIGTPTVLAKGRKDRKVLDKMGFQSIRFSSETFTPTHLPESIKWVLYDNDYNKAMNQGQISAEKICTTFNKKNLVIPSYYQCTDIPELAEKLGLTEARRVLLELIN